MQAIVWIAFSLAFSIPLCAQTAQISGEVRDPSGAVVANAEVRAINQATFVERHAKTNRVGLYAFPFLDPGRYQIVVEAPGFTTAVSEVLTIAVDQVLVFNVQLRVGEIRETMTVRAESQVIDSTDAQVSTLVDERQMNSLPLILRDPYQLILLTAGVNASDNTGVGGFTVNGGRVTNNNFRLDGADNNDVEGSTAGIVTINPDMTQEFRVITTGYLPEFGRNNGAVVDIVSKSGTNQLHGDVYEFGRYAALGARDYFNNASTGPKNPYTRNDFGGSLGGAIRKDKTFFFGNYEAQRFATTLTNTATVPLPALLTGKFTYVGFDQNTGNPVSFPVDFSTPNSPNNLYHLRLDPMVHRILSMYPAATVPNPDGIDGQLFFPSPDHLSANNYTIKIDHHFSPWKSLSAHYVANQLSDSNSGHTDFLPGLGTLPSNSLTQSFAAHLTSSLGGGPWINEFTGAWNRVRGNSSCGGLSTIDSVRPTDQFGHGTDFAWPGSIASWECASPFDQTSGVYTISDQVTRVLGRHLIKFGAEFAGLHSNSSTNFVARIGVNFGNFTTNFAPAITTLASPPNTNVDLSILQDTAWALFGEVNQQSQGQFFDPSGRRLPTDEVQMREHDVATFWQDSFKITPNFTLNYGLRWEFNGAPYEARNLLSNVPLAQLSGPAPIIFQNTSSLYARDWLAVQPRFGFAWDPLKNGKTSFRTGYGVFRDHTFFAATDIVRGNPPLTEQTVSQIFIPTRTGFTGTAITDLPIPPNLKPTRTVQPGAGVFALTFDPNFHLPYSQNWNVGLQQQFPGNIDLDLNYVGIQGKRLLRAIDGNAPIPSLVAKLREYCQQPNPLGCVDTPTESTIQGFNLYFGKELGILPFDAVRNNAIFHAQVIQTGGSSTYNALQATVTRRFSNGMFFQGAYAWSHEIDDSAGSFGPSVDNAILPANSFKLRQERGNGAQDIRQALTLNYTAELPLGAGKTRLNKGFLGKTLEGWSLSGIYHVSGGFPYDIFILQDTDGTGGLGTTRPNFNPHAPRLPLPGVPFPVTGPNAGFFSIPSYGGPGNLPRNFFRVPGLNNWDMVLAKNTRLGDRFHLEFRAEAFNVFNHVHFSPPSDFYVSGFLDNFSESFSEVQRPDGTTGARQVQVALKLNF